MTKRTIWISYDLGIRGDYGKLYAWLDRYSAKECGDSVAVLEYDYNGSLVESVKAELNDNVSIDRKSRIYVIYRDEKTNNLKGKFIFGNRKAAAWTGYAYSDADNADEEV